MSVRLLLVTLFVLLLAAPLFAQETLPAPEPAPNTTRLFIQGSVDLLGVQAPVYDGMSGTQAGFGQGLAVGYGFTPNVTLYGAADFVGFVPPEEMELDFRSGREADLTAGTAVLKAGLRFNLPFTGSRLVPYADAGVALVGTVYQYASSTGVLYDGEDMVETTTGGFGAFGGLGLQIAVTPEVFVRVGAEVLATRYTVFDDFDGSARTFDDPRHGLNGGLRVGVVAYPFR